MAGANVILSRLCDLQGTNFEVIVCQVKEDEIIWRIQHKAEAQYICPRCGAIVDSCRDRKWIKLHDQSTIK